MKKRRSWVTKALIVGLFVSSVLAGCAGQKESGQAEASKQNKKLVMATSADYPPYEFHDTSGEKDEIVGLDVDIAKYIAKEMGVELEIKDMDFNGLLPALQANRADFVMAGMTPTEERKKSVAFTETYYEAKNTIVAKTGSNLTKMEDLAGKKVVVQLGSTQQNAVEEAAKTIKGIEVTQLNKIGDLIQELKSGRAQATIIEDTVAKGYVVSNKDLEMNAMADNGENAYAVALPIGSAHVEKFNQAIKKLKESGELDKLTKKWFDK
ncbi:ABC transporter substrate-binding protein [Brevibacillus choshinensis]|uniref:ABC transporter substrate-binding protein n=1 Tax=Brevibacillus choshinensis TaxID=54911 RepID=A0ABR5N3G6_BRECH|nr:transporter substrate-binding domain-containing protein [Brevibacillus choshinensis]KQL45049.1 ABC transporter substrate-binding protein [Brevibacillus choshinensis]